MDTTANAMSRVLHLLAQHPDVQEKLRQEVTEARTRGDLDYDALHALPFLDAVCRETLRLYVYPVFSSRPPLTIRRTILDMRQLPKRSEGTCALFPYEFLYVIMTSLCLAEQ